MCTGWTHNFSPFSMSARAEIGLPCKADPDSNWAEKDAQADCRVDQLLPNLNSIPKEMPKEAKIESPAGQPWRLYRRLVSPEMVEAGNRSIYFPGQVHSVFTPLLCEIQALWGAAFLLGMLPMPNKEAMQEEIALWNSWTKKRYLAQGKKHAYAIYDYLAVRRNHTPSQKSSNNRSMSTASQGTLVSGRTERATLLQKCSHHIGQAITRVLSMNFWLCRSNRGCQRSK